MKYLLIIALTLFTTSAFASRTPTNINTNINTPKFSAAQKTNQTVNQIQGQHQKQGLQNEIDNDVAFIARKNKRFAPGFGLAYMSPTSICLGTTTVAGSMWLGGLGGGTTYEVNLCMQMETIRVIGFMIQNTLPTPAGLLRREKLMKGSEEILCMTTWASKSPTLCPEQAKQQAADTSTGSPGAPERRVKIEDTIFNPFNWFN